MPSYLLAIVLAFGSSICFAGNRAVASRPLVKSDPSIATYVTLLVGLVVTAVAVLVSNEAGSLLNTSLFIISVFSIVGIFHFTIGRQLSYVAVKNIGANTTSPLLSTAILYSMVFAVIFLNESVTLPVAVGAALVLFGVLMLEIRTSALMRGGDLKVGYIAALVSGMIFGLTPVIIKFGLSLYQYYIAATFISYAAATILYSLVMNTRELVQNVRTTPQSALVPYVISGVFAVFAQLFRYSALSFAPVVIIAPILNTNPVFTVIMTRKIAKDIEVFRLRTILGIVIVVIGTVLVSVYSGVS